MKKNDEKPTNGKGNNEKPVLTVSTAIVPPVQQPTQEAKPKALPVPHIPSIEELQAKAMKTFHLSERYNEIKDKKAQVDRFAIIHEKENAQLTITDAKGEEIITSNPKSIKQVLEIWKKDLAEALGKTEQEIRELLTQEEATSEEVKKAA